MTSAKVRDRSLLAGDFAGGQGVLGVARVGSGRSRFRLAFTPRVVVASEERVPPESTDAVAMAAHPPTDLALGCPDGCRDAAVLTTTRAAARS